MSITLARTILQERRIACAVTDCDLRIVEVDDPEHIMSEFLDSCRGRSLVDSVPELIGYEEALSQIVNGQQPCLQMPWINRVLPNGQPVYLAMTFLPYRDRAESIVGLLYLVRDVTEVGALEHEVAQRRNELLLARDQLTEQNVHLAASDAELKRLNGTKSSFVAIAAHELRTPLTSIMGYTELLLGGDAGPLSHQQADYLSIIQDGAQRLLCITNNLLDVTRLEAGRLDLVLQPTDFHALVESVLAEQGALLTAKSQHLTLQAPAHLPPILCDPARAAQIIGNLIDNAGKFSAPGGAVAVRLCEAAEPGFVQISVTDHGVGILPEEQAAIFKPFGRIGSAGAGDTNGAGLGLFIARSLIDLHGGRIWFDSTPGEVTTFHVLFPIADQTPVH